MKLENQVVSLDLAKRLKELGVEQESIHWWAKSAYDGKYQIILFKDYKSFEFSDEPGYGDFFDHISAFTVAELGQMLPYSLDISYPTSYLYTVKIDKYNYRSCYANGIGVISYKNKRLQQVANTEVDARAKMLIYLLKNKLITL